MAKTPYIAQDNIDNVTVIASAPISSGDMVEVGGNLRGIAISDADSGDKVAIQRSGLARDVAKAAPLVITAGDLVYWSESGDEVTKTDTDKPLGTAAADAASGAVLVDVYLGAGSFSEAAQVDQVYTDFASVANGKGASLQGIEDAATIYTATTTEGALAEVKAIVDDAPTMADAADGAGQLLIAGGADKTIDDTEIYATEPVAGTSGAGLRLYDDAGNYWELQGPDGDGVDTIAKAEHIVHGKEVAVTFTGGQATASITDTDLIGGTVVCYGCVTSNQALINTAIDGSGVLTLTCGGAQTNAAVYTVRVKLA